MSKENGAVRLKRELLVATARLAYEGRLAEGIDRVPYELTSGDAYKPSLCCAHHDRQAMRSRLAAAMGFALEDRVDDGTPLADLARRAVARKPGSDGPGDPVLTIVGEACNGCVKSRILVTEACQACVARPCETMCPKGSIKVSGGKASIDGETCVECGLCAIACPFKAIIKLQVPCEEACPVGAIGKGPDGKERLDRDACVSCGACLKACPFGAVTDVSRLVDIVEAIRSGKRVAAILAPAVAAQFRAPLGALASAIRAAGFSSIHEAAVGADEAAAMEAEEFAERIGAGEPFMTTSCCPAFVETASRHVPGLIERISRTPSPMSLAAASVRAAEPGTVTVFIGPCVAKRREALAEPAVDYVMSAEELGAAFVALGIEVADAEEIELPDQASREGRGFAAAGGVSAAVRSIASAGADFRPMLIDGLSKESMAALRALARGERAGNFVEVMACKGGCLGGPCAIANPKVAALQLKRLAESSEPLVDRHAAPEARLEALARD